MHTQWESLANDHILGIAPYEPGKPIEELERELGIHDAIKLASNENPLAPSDRVREAITAALPTLNRYPDGSGFYLRQGLAKKHGVSPEVKSTIIKGELPSPLNPPPGCAFHSRCPFATERCRKEAPAFRHYDGRQVACHYAEQMSV